MSRPKRFKPDQRLVFARAEISSTGFKRPPPHLRGYDARWRKLRRIVLAESPICNHCGAPAVDVDHIIPLSRGGTHDRENLQPLCHACHSRKTVLEDGGLGYGRSRQKDF